MNSTATTTLLRIKSLKEFACNLVFIKEEVTSNIKYGSQLGFRDEPPRYCSNTRDDALRKLVSFSTSPEYHIRATGLIFKSTKYIGHTFASLMLKITKMS